MPVIGCRVPAPAAHAANGAHSPPARRAPIERRRCLRPGAQGGRGHKGSLGRCEGRQTVERGAGASGATAELPQPLSRTAGLARGARPPTPPRLPHSSPRRKDAKERAPCARKGPHSPAARRRRAAPTQVASPRCRRPLLMPRRGPRSTRPAGPHPRPRCHSPIHGAASPRRDSVAQTRAGARGRERCRHRVRGPAQLLPWYGPRDQLQARRTHCNSEGRALGWSRRQGAAGVAPVTPPPARQQPRGDS